jgi:pseudouridine-5'-phosphate glycosidase/pseudouridine kinase
MAAHYAGAKVSLASAVANDLAGSSLLEHLKHRGMPTEHIRQLRVADGARTAQYVAVNDTNKDLVVAMADMSILTRPEMEDTEFWTRVMTQCKPKWVVLDANWSPTILSAIIEAAKIQGAMIAFEPVSVAKAARLFHVDNQATTSTNIVPNHVINLATPNNHELNAIYAAARDASMFETEEWWKVIDSFGLSGSTLHDRLASVAGLELINQGIPQQSVQLLPFIPNIVTKLGRRGCLMASLIRRGDPKLTSPDFAPYILARNLSDESQVGGLYLRLFPPSENVPQADIVSVNGIGDTMLGVMVTGLAQGLSLDQVIPIAQEAAVLTLKSTAAVSSEVSSLQAKLR